VKSGPDGIGGHLLQLTGDNGGEQELRLICSNRLDSRPVLPKGLNNAVPASPPHSAAGTASKPHHRQTGWLDP
jgi:hypothetical protein